MNIKKLSLRFAVAAAVLTLGLGGLSAVPVFAAAAGVPLFKVTPQGVYCGEEKQKVRVKYQAGSEKPYNISLERVGVEGYVDTMKLEKNQIDTLKDPVALVGGETADYKVWAYRVNVEPYVLEEFTSNDFLECPSGTPPIANDDFATTPKNTSVVVDALANDTDADGDELVLMSVDQPTHGKAAITKSDKIRYTPEKDFCGDVSRMGYYAHDGNGNKVYAIIEVNVTC